MNRRLFLQGSTALMVGSHWLSAPAQPTDLIIRPIPATGELLPVMGMGSSRTFDTGLDEATLAKLGAVMRAFFNKGGTLIDSSPMYGAAETVLGAVLSRLEPQPGWFAATK
ncbi:MAG: aldo/keto reductase, partial [Gammaproteobacteria bacterium]|nr:aldo/keto reductase [Gammaproteobacteria bacterium]